MVANPEAVNPEVLNPEALAAQATGHVGPAQREVLDELARWPPGQWVCAEDVARTLAGGGTPTRSQLGRVRRAVHVLARAGRVEEDRHLLGTAGGRARWMQVARIPLEAAGPALE